MVMRQSHYVMIKGSIHQEAITIVNMHSTLEHLNIPTDIKGEMDNTIIVGDINIPLQQ